MCGAYSIPEEAVVETFDAIENRRRYAVRPFDSGPIVTHEGVVEADQWSLTPAWSREKRVKFATFNARLDKLVSSKVWRTVFPSKRCLVPVDGFFERVPEEGAKKKRPYYVQMRDKSSFCFAGLWQDWTDKETGEIIKTFTVVTTDNNDLMERIGHHRMPAIVSPEHQAAWLDPDVQDKDLLMAMIREPEPSENLQAYPVGYEINYRDQHGPEIIEPIGELVTVG